MTVRFLLRLRRSGNGTKQTSQSRRQMSAFGGKADIGRRWVNVVTPKLTLPVNLDSRSVGLHDLARRRDFISRFAHQTNRCHAVTAQRQRQNGLTLPKSA